MRCIQQAVRTGGASTLDGTLHEASVEMGGGRSSRQHGARRATETPLVAPTSWMVYSTLSWCSLPTPPPSSQAPLFSPCVAVGILMPMPAALFLIGLLLDGVYVSARHYCRRVRSVPVPSSVSGSVNAPLNPRTELPFVDASSSHYRNAAGFRDHDQPAVQRLRRTYTFYRELAKSHRLLASGGPRRSPRPRR